MRVGLVEIRLGSIAVGVELNQPNLAMHLGQSTQLRQRYRVITSKVDRDDTGPQNVQKAPGDPAVGLFDIARNDREVAIVHHRQSVEDRDSASAVIRAHQRRGAEVVLVERETLGSQSTGRCAGGIRRQFSSAANVVMQQLSVQLLSGLEAETGVDPEFRHIGYLFVLTSDSQVADFRRLLPMWHKTGVTEDRKSVV